MKHLTILTLIIVVILGCKDNPVVEKAEEIKDNVQNTTRAVKEMDSMKEDMETLAGVTPLTNEELKNWLPDEINGMTRTGFKVGQMGVVAIASVDATYENQDKTKKFRFQLLDGAGEMGSSAIAGARMLLTQEFEEETQNRIKRTSARNGLKYIEEFRKDGSKSSLQFVYDDRFYLDVNGTNLTMEELWSAIDEMPLDKLQ